MVCDTFLPILAICLLDDLNSAWASLLAAAEAKDKERRKDKLVKADNIIEVNLVLGIQANHLIAMRKHVNHEVFQFQLFCPHWFLL